MHIPFCPIPVKKAQKLLGNTFYGVAEPVIKMSPSIELELKQAGFDINARDYLSIAFFSAIFMFLLTYFAFAVIAFKFVGMYKVVMIALLVGMVFGFVTFFYIKAYPKLIVKKRMYDIERNVLYALRHMYVQVTSGVSLFEAIASVSNGEYGQISMEFKNAIKTINTGMPIEKALEELTLRNPSVYFRRAMWQISNGVKSGSDIGSILKNIIDYIGTEQKIMIRRYGSQLNPLTVAYMMVAVIIPSLGVTFLMVISSFAKIPVTELMFWGILGFITIFQFMFLGILKSKRPNMI
jgi:flagellar protein FlaJ